MTLLSTARLETFARLIALGWPPMLAANGAGYRNRRAGRTAARLAAPGVSARIAELAPPPETDEPPPAAGKKARRAAPEAETVDTAPPARPPLEPMMTEEEWLAEFGPMLRARAADYGAGAGVTCSL